MMTKEGFQQLWALNYPDTVPISHLFKHNYPDRWLRIHSLPESKRYAENNTEWEILLSRQNEIITDLFGVDTPVLLVTGDYNCEAYRKVHITDEEEVYRAYNFTMLDHIDLHKTDAELYAADTYRPAYAETIWKPNFHDNLLRKIANDDFRAFFVSFDKNVIVAPYDGGIDFVLKDRMATEKYSTMYKQWLSKREDGL